MANPLSTSTSSESLGRVTVTIPHTAFPHIMELIIRYGTRASLSGLRRTSKHYNSLITNMYDSHISFHSFGSDRVLDEDSTSEAWIYDRDLNDQQLALHPLSPFGDRVLHCNYNHPPPTGHASWKSSLRIIDLHYMPHLDGLTTWSCILHNPDTKVTEPQSPSSGLEVLRLLHVNCHGWQGKVPFPAKTLIAFLPTSVQPYGWKGLVQSLLPPRGDRVNKLVLHFAVEEPATKAYIEHNHTPFLTTFATSVQEIVIIASYFKHPRPKIATCGEPKSTWVNHLLYIIRRHIATATITLVNFRKAGQNAFSTLAAGVIGERFFTEDERRRLGGVQLDTITSEEANEIHAVATRDYEQIHRLVSKMRFLTFDEYESEVGKKQFLLETVQH